MYKLKVFQDRSQFNPEGLKWLTTDYFCGIFSDSTIATIKPEELISSSSADKFVTPTAVEERVYLGQETEDSPVADVSFSNGDVVTLNKKHAAYRLDSEKNTVKPIGFLPAESKVGAGWGNLNPDGSLSYAVVDDSLVLWEVSSGKISSRIKLSEFLLSLFCNADIRTSWHPSANWCISTTPGTLIECIFFWSTDAEQKELKHSLLSIDSKSLFVSGSEISPCGTKLMIFTDKATLIYSCKDMDPLEKPPELVSEFPGAWTCGGFSNLSGKVALISSHSELSQFKVTGTAEIHDFNYPKNTIELQSVDSNEKCNSRYPFLTASDCKFSPNDKYVAIMFGCKFYRSWYQNSEDGCCVVYSTVDGTVVAKLSPPAGITLSPRILWNKNPKLTDWELCVLEVSGTRSFLARIEPWCFQEIDQRAIVSSDFRIDPMDSDAYLYIKGMIESQWTKLNPTMPIRPSELSIQELRSDREILYHREVELKGLATMFDQERRKLTGDLHSSIHQHNVDTSKLKKLEQEDKEKETKIVKMSEEKNALQDEIENAKQKNREMEATIALQQEQLGKCRCEIL